MKKILFVCHGNICRSPMAEFVMKHIVKEAGVAEQFYIESAATSTEELGNTVYPPARRELSLHGISCKGKTARQMTRSDYVNFDFIVCMDDRNYRNILRMIGGDSDGKVHKLLSFAGSADDIDDPWYTGDFRTTYLEIEEGCTALLRELIDEL